MQVGGHSRDSAAFHLLLATSAMTFGFLFVAAFIVPLRRHGIHPDRVLAVGMGIGLVAMLGVLMGIGASHVLWFFLGLSFAFGNIAYAQHASHFPPALAGRANTALNLGAFLGAFVIQWGYGALLDRLTAGGWALADAHRVVFGSLLALQGASFAWYLIGKPKSADARQG